MALFLTFIKMGCASVETNSWISVAIIIILLHFLFNITISKKNERVTYIFKYRQHFPKLITAVNCQRFMQVKQLLRNEILPTGILHHHPPCIYARDIAVEIYSRALLNYLGMPPITHAVYGCNNINTVW